jgi:eukaryotic-like serine/threonine-protein kinase
MGEELIHIGPYRILGPLGAGAMGVVYRAEDSRTGQPAALKTVSLPSASVLQSLRREVHALAGIRHPGIVRILDEGVDEGLPWYAMELIEGTTLRRLAGRRPEPGSATGRALAEPEPTAREAALPPSSARPAQAWWTETLAARPLPEGPVVLAATAAGAAATAPGHAAHLSLSSAQAPARASEQQPAAAGDALVQALTLVRRLCASLAFLHGEGIVHRDLKPENILVRPDGTPVIVDFGIMAQWPLASLGASRLHSAGSGPPSRESFELAGLLVGTAGYMAPEQIRGDLVDARADLYSLGCLLYELLTGRKPFVGVSADEVLWQHLEATPVPPSRRVEGLPPELDELVLRLLHKERSERIGHAGAAAAVLEALGAEGWPGEPPPPRAYLYRPGFAGRGEALDRLMQPLIRLGSGHGCLALLGGESGIGKTRLAMELGRQASLREIRVLVGECLPDAEAPLQALRRPLQAVADRCLEQGLAETERLLGPRGKLLARHVPALAHLPGQSRHPEPAELPPDAARLRLMRALTETFAALADGPRAESGERRAASAAEEAPSQLVARGSLLIVLDDLQWADELTLAFLEHLLRGGHLERMPLLIVGTYRSEELGEGQGPGAGAARHAASLRALLGAPQVCRVELGRLEADAVGSMVGEMLALRPPPAVFTRFLARCSEGNPFFVAEYLRTAVDEGLLYRDERGRWQVGAADEQVIEATYERLPLPRALQELVGRRLRGLGPEAAALAEMGAVLGREIDAALLDAAAAPDGLAELLRRQILEEPAPGRLRFGHDKLREAVIERLDPARRRGLHRAAAERLEARTSAHEDGFTDLAARAHHWQEAGEPELARPHWLEAARRARERHASAEAERLYRAYLALADPPSRESIEVRIELALRVLSLTGRHAQAVEQFQRALEQARALGEREAEVSALQGLAGLARLGGRLEESRRLDEEALGLARRIGARRAEGGALRSLATLAMEQDAFAESEALFREALELQQAIGDHAALGVTLGNLATLHWVRGELLVAAELYDEALRLHRRSGNRRSEATTLCNRAMIDWKRGDAARARERYEQALAIQREIGDRHFEAITLSNLVPIERDAGRVQTALDLCTQALAIRREAGGQRHEAFLLMVLASLERMARGDLDRAEQLARESETLFRGLNASLEAARSLCERGRIALAAGQPARPWLEAAEQACAGAKLGPESLTATDMTRLRKAIEAAEAGRPMVRGEVAEELPEGLRRWFAQAGLLG